MYELFKYSYVVIWMVVGAISFLMIAIVKQVASYSRSYAMRDPGWLPIGQIIPQVTVVDLSTNLQMEADALSRRALFFFSPEASRVPAISYVQKTFGARAMFVCGGTRTQCTHFIRMMSHVGHPLTVPVYLSAAMAEALGLDRDCVIVKLDMEGRIESYSTIIKNQESFSSARAASSESA